VRRVGGVELPPEELDALPYLYGQPRYKEFDELKALQAYCEAWGAVPDSRKGGYLQACYIPGLNTVVTPSRDAWPSQREVDGLRMHEEGHAKGWKHGTSRLYDWKAQRYLE
jgi:antirestriction protein ArdC